MLDIGFSELVVIGVVALVVIGPERLPRVARTVGHLMGRFQRYVADVKSDINREIELADLKKIRADVEEAARSVEHTVKSEMQAAEEQIRTTEAELNQAGDGLRQMQAEVNESLASLSMPHMGMGQAAGTEPPADPPPPSQEALPAPEAEASPQMELGLRNDAVVPAAAPASTSDPATTRQA
jgi:sec-independent protein translocase protein TatB